MRFFLDKYNHQNYIPIGCTSIVLADASKLVFLCNFLRDNRTVTKLDFYRNEIGDGGVKKIAEALKANRTVAEIDLQRTGIGMEGVEAIAEMLKVNCTVTRLNLGGNYIGNKAAKSIFEALKVNCTIKKLYLWSNSIGNEGARAIFEALKVNWTLKHLDLSFNRIKDESEEMKAIAKALKVNCTISDELKPIVIEEKCKTMALGLFQKVPIYLLLDIHELVIISDLERKTNSYKFYDNACFLKFLEKKVSKKHLLRMMDKVNRQLI